MSDREPDMPPEDRPSPEFDPLDADLPNPAPIVEYEPGPDDLTTEDAEPTPPVPAVLYAEVPDPFAEGSLVAHDRQALIAAIAAGDRRRGIQAADDLVWSPESRVRDIEEATLAHVRGRRSRLRYRRIYWRILAIALPFLVASLLGAAGLLIRQIPIIGAPLGEFVGSAGASVGGLPLGLLIAILPSIWLWRRRASGQDGYWPRLPRRLPDELEFTPVPGDIAGLLADLEATILESRQLASSRRSAAGTDAQRLEEVIHRAYRIAHRAGIDVAASLYLDLRRRLHRAGRCPTRRLGFLARRRVPAVFAELVGPYKPSNSRPSSPHFIGIPHIAGGVIAAGLIFLIAGLFRVGPNDFEVVRPNRAWAYPGSLDYLVATQFSWVTVDGVEVSSAIPVDGPGWFWTWPVPFTRREHIATVDRLVSAEALVGPRDETLFDTVQIDFRYSIRDSRAWVRHGLNVDAEAAVADILAQNLADFMEQQRQELITQQRPDVTEALKDSMKPILESYLGVVNNSPEIRGLGVEIESVTAFGFAIFSP